MDYPGWTVETTHPIEEAEGVTVCDPCLNAIDPLIAFAEDWGSTAFGTQFENPEGVLHYVVVRKVVTP